MLIRNSILYIISKIVPGILGMATTSILTRLLEPGRYGLYGLALVMMNFGAAVGFDWLGISFQRFYQARREDPRVVGTFVRLFGIVVLLSALAALGAGALGAFSGAGAPIYAAGIVLMWSFAWFEFVAKIEVAKFRPAKYLIMNLGRAAFILAAAGTAAWLTRDPVLTAAGTALGICGGALLAGFRGWWAKGAGFDRGLARAVLAFGLPLAASMIMSGLLNSGSRALVGFLGSAEALGFYTAAYMLTQNTLAVASSGVAAAGYSLAVRAVESGDPVAARRQLSANATILLAVIAPASIGMALTAPGIASVLVGAQYGPAVVALTPWMALGAFFAAFRENYLDHAFQLGRRPDLQLGVTALAAAVAITLCFVLIPREGPKGAAIAIAVAMGVSCVHGWIAGRHAYRLPLPLVGAARISAACAVMAVVVLVVPVLVIPGLALPGGGLVQFVLQVSGGGLTYCATAIALDVLSVRSRVVGFITTGAHWLVKLPG